MGGHILVQPSIVELRPSLSASHSPIRQSSSRVKTFVPPHRNFVPFFGFDEGPNVTVVVPSPAVAEDAVMQPHPTAPAVFFIERCGHFIRVPLPEAQKEVLSVDQQQCK
jgi:hypothetical protein